MKFLCIPCDKPLKLETTDRVEGGSISLVYGCPDCGYEVAMLTNPHETQMVTSLGVQIGGKTESKCPFTGMVGDLAEGPPADATAVQWTTEARERIGQVPEMVQDMVRSGIERFAQQKGYKRVDERVLDEARDFFEGAGFTL